MEQTYMKEKKILPLVLSMSYPMMLSMAVGALYNIIDSFYVAGLDEKAMTALSLLYPIQNFSHAIIVGFAIGINAVVSYFLGAGNEKKANTATTTGFVLNTLHGIILAIFCIQIMPFFLKMFTGDSQVIGYGINYTNLVFLFAIFDAAGIAFEKIFQAVGRMKTTMFCMAIGCIVNIVLDPLLIFGIGFFPRMGIAGAALATGIGQVLTFFLYLAFYLLRPLPVKVSKNHFVIERNLLRRLYSIGCAASLNMALPSLQVSILNKILAGYSGSYVFVLGVYYKLQTFLYLSANGIVQGIRPLVGYNYGAREIKRVKSIYHISLMMVISIMTLGTLLCLIIPDQLFSLFTHNSQVISIGSYALRIISIGFIVSSISVITSGVLEGLGKGMASLIISLIRYLVVILPIAVVLNHFFEVIGVWHAFWITEIFAAVISYYIYGKLMKSWRDK